VNATWPHGDPQALARAILADPRYRGTTTSDVAGPDPISQLLMWIGRHIGTLMHAIGRLLGTHSTANNVIAVAVLAAIVAGIALLVWRFLLLPGRRSTSARSGSVTLGDDLSSAALLALAFAAARDERWHDAASALVRAAMRALDERGRLRFDPARTPGEARRLLHDPAFDAFEREATTALFADGAATPERFTRMRAAFAAAFGDPA
jgi:hypothetical protein